MGSDKRGLQVIKERDSRQSAGQCLFVKAEGGPCGDCVRVWHRWCLGLSHMSGGRGRAGAAGDGGARRARAPGRSRGGGRARPCRLAAQAPPRGLLSHFLWAPCSCPPLLPANGLQCVGLGVQRSALMLSFAYIPCPPCLLADGLQESCSPLCGIGCAEQAS